MKIQKLDFIAYGQFNDVMLDFSKKDGGLQIVFGNNEAGKSVALRGITSLLYGISERTKDSFIHDNQRLRIGGSLLHSGGSELSFVRRKGRSNTILNYDSTPIKDEILKKFLDNTTQEVFLRLFGINHTQLVEGGQDIISGHGGAGESIFSAGMGKIKLHEVLKEIEADADDLFKPRGRKKINQAIESYNNTKKEMVQNSLKGQKWIEYQEMLKKAGHQRKDLMQKLDNLRKEHNYLERIKNSLRFIAELKAYSHELSLMGEVVILPPEFSDVRKELVYSLGVESAALNDVSRQLQNLKDEIAKIELPQEILSHEKIIIEYNQRLGSHLKAESDSIQLLAKIEQLHEDTKKILEELRPDKSFSDIETIRLSKVRRMKIRDIADRYTSLIARRRDKEESLKSLASDIDKLHVSLDETEKPVDLKNLKAFLKGIQSQANLEDELKAAKSKYQSESKKAGIALKRLPLWDRPLEELEMAEVPTTETINVFDHKFSDLLNKIKLIAEKIISAEDKTTKIQKELNTLEYAGYIPSEFDLLEARQWRQKGWHLILNDWIEGKADADAVKEFASQKKLHIAYEESVNNADDISDRLRREADRVAKKAHLLSEISSFEEEKERLQSEKEQLNRQFHNLQEDWEKTWSRANIKPLSPQEMREWINLYRQLIQQSETINSHSTQIDDIANRIEALRTEILSNLLSAGLQIEDKTIPLKNLIGLADSYVERNVNAINESLRLKDRLNELLKQKEKEEKEMLSCGQEIEELMPEWSALVRDLGLSDQAVLFDVNVYLEMEQELFKKIDDAKGFSKRIDDIKRDAVEFSKNVNELISKAAPELQSMSVQLAVTEIYLRLLNAKQDDTKIVQIKKQMKQKEEQLEKTNKSILEKRAKLRIMCQQAGCADEDKLAEIEQKSKKAVYLQDMIEQAQKHLRAYCGSKSLDEFIKEAEMEDVDAIGSKLIKIDGDIINCENELSEVDRTIGELENEMKRMDGGDLANESMQKAEGLLADIRTNVERYLKLRLASSILNYEIEIYRQRNQSPLLKRAEEIFTSLTLNSFISISTSYDENDRVVLVCKRPSGEEVGIEGMSEGTRDQLYLSLRLASLEKYLAENEPLPFIVDDILVNFDDRRAESCLKILTELSKKTQVIFFTHHKHLVEIAKDAIAPEQLQIHSLQ